MNGVGAHEIVIETSKHDETLSTLPNERVIKVLTIYRERILDLSRDQRIKYIPVFKNHGADAGASLEHSHSQIIALPIVPKRVNEEIDGAKAYYEYIEIIPKLTKVAGFEWGTGFYINPTPPEEAAKYLREARLQGNRG